MPNEDMTTVLFEVRELRARLDSHVDAEEEAQDRLAVAVNEFGVALRGDEERAGLFERVRNLETLAAEARSLKHWFMVAVGGMLLTLLFNALTWYIENSKQ